MGMLLSHIVQPSHWRSLIRHVLTSLFLVLFTAQLWTAPALATGVYQMPSLSAGDPTWIVDEANLLSRINKIKIGGRLAELAENTGNEVRFVTIHRLDYGETPESFTEQLFEKWFPTPEAQANQTILFIDDVTNGVAIRTGDAVKQLMSDDIAESVAQETVMVPLRENNKYNQAFLDATDRLVAVLSGQEDPGPPVVNNTIQVEGTFATPEETESSNATLIVIVLLVLATAIPMVTYYWYVR